MKSTTKRVRISSIVVSLILIGVISAIPEIIANIRPLIPLESGHLYNISSIAVNTLVILGLIIGTILSFAKHETEEIKFGYTANERILYFNTLRIHKYKINLLEMLLISYLLIPVAIGCFLFSWHNAVLTVLLISLVITFFEFMLSIVIISNNSENIDRNCKEAIQSEIAKDNFATMKKMLLSFYNKIDDAFIFGDEYNYFVESMKKIKEDAAFSGYYPEVQRLISGLISDRRLNANRTSKLVHDLILTPSLKGAGSIVIYLDEAIIWAADHTDWETETLFNMLEYCHNKFFANSYKEEYEIDKLMKNFYKLFIGLENNKLMNSFDQRKNIAEMEKMAFEFATLKRVHVLFQQIGTDYYIEFDEEKISTLQIPLFLIIDHYTKTHNDRIVDILHMLNKKEHILSDSPDDMDFRLDFNNAKLKYLLVIKFSYYFFVMANRADVSDERVAFIKKVIYTSQRGISFAYMLQNIRLSKALPVRKDTYYDYFFPVYMKKEYMEYVTHLVCLSILRGFRISYKSFIDIEVGYAVKMFDENGKLKSKCREYMKSISEFYGIAYSEKRSKNVFAKIMNEAKKYDLDYMLNKDQYVQKKKDMDFFDDKLIN